MTILLDSSILQTTWNLIIIITLLASNRIKMYDSNNNDQYTFKITC